MLPYYVDLKEKVSYFIAGTKQPVTYTCEQDTLIFDWKQYVQTGVDIYVDNLKDVIADALILELGETTVLNDLRVLDTDGNIVALSKAQNGKVTVELGVKREGLIIRIIPDLTDICIKELKLVCVDDNKKFVFPAPSEFEFKGNTIVPITAMSFCASSDDDAFLGLGTLSFRSEYDILIERQT